MSWTLSKNVDAFAGPGEIKRREVSWALTKKSDVLADPGEIKRREVVLDPPVGPEEIKSREVELGSRAGLLLLQLFPSCGATDIVFVTPFCIAVGTAIGWCCVAAQCRTDTALTSCCSSGGPRQPWSSGLAPVSRFHSSVPLFPLVPFPNRPSRRRGR